MPLPDDRVLDDEIARELRPLAAKLSLTMPQAVMCLAEIAASLHDRFPPNAEYNDPAPMVLPRPSAELALAA